MATNFEFYKNEILKITSKNKRVAIKEGKIVECEDLGSCARCYFHGGCEKKHFEWLYEEHIEKPKLTKRERAFCEYVGYGYIARDEFDKKCYWFPDKPIKSDGEWCSDGMFMWVLNNVAPFAFVKWEDEKPWALEDLLKLQTGDE